MCSYWFMNGWHNCFHNEVEIRRYCEIPQKLSHRQETSHNVFEEGFYIIYYVWEFHKHSMIHCPAPVVPPQNTKVFLHLKEKCIDFVLLLAVGLHLYPCRLVHHLGVKYIDNYCMNCYEICGRHSCSILMIPDFSSRTINRSELECVQYFGL